MKQVVVLTSQAFEESLQQIFKEQSIPVFSRANVEGVENAETEPDISNWFGASRDADLSVMYFAFVEDHLADSILEAVQTWNSSNDTSSTMHAYSLNVENYVN